MISIISPVYNEEKYIVEAVSSVLNQSYKNIEVIFVDDQSKDNTLGLLKDMASKDTRLQVFLNPKKGKVNAVNLAFEKTQGDWIMFMAGDDIMEEGILEKWAECAKNHQAQDELIAFASKIREFSEDEEYKRFNGIIIPKKDVATIMGSNYMMSRKIAEIMFPLPTNYPNEDGWTRLCFRYLNFNTVFVNAIALNYRRHANNSVNPNAPFSVFNESYHARKIVANEFLEKYKNALSDSQMKLLEAEIKIENQRYKGNSVGVLFSNHSPVSEKIRNFMLSKPVLYKIKLKLEKFLLGISMK